MKNVAVPLLEAFHEELKSLIASGEMAEGTEQIDHYLARRCRIPAGTVGHTYVHKEDHIAICLSGTVILTDQDKNTTKVVGPSVLFTKAGTQRAVYAVTDVDFVTLHEFEHAGIEPDLTNVKEALGCRTMLEFSSLLTHEEV